MPTSLIHILLSTRGFSPWRPEAVISTAMIECFDLLEPVFQGLTKGTVVDAKNASTLTEFEPYLELNSFQGP